MKILLLTGSINQGGAEFQLLALADLLQRNGYDIEILAITNHSYYLPYIHENKLCYGFISNEGNSLLRIFRSVKAISKIKPDLVISYIRVTSQVAMLARLVNFFRFKLIISERTSLILPLYDFFYFNLALLANKITVNSASKLKYIETRFPLIKNKTVFVPNIINIKKYSLAVEKSYSAKTLVLGCVGRVSPEKNLIRLVKAIELLLVKGYDLKLVIIGQTNHPAHLSEVKNSINTSQFPGRFEIAGASTDILKDYEKIDLLCHVSLYEGFSNVISEAICSGVPVIGSNIEEISYFITDRVNGFLVNPISDIDIADGIERFIKLTPAEKIAFSLNARKKARELFDENVIVEQYAGMFGSLKLKQ